MNTLIKSITVTALAALVTLTTSAAAPTSATQFTPKMMNYQGYLADPATGNPYADGIYTLELRLYRSATGGTAIWGGRYSAYVKGGYFNIMLGHDSATNLGYTYNNVDLWRALWKDTSASEPNQLWLGVTPQQDSSHATISSPVELLPRQQLLTAPYAFRAQSAEYANQSYGDFTVNGKLTLAGSIAFPSSYTLKWITADSTKLALGGSSYTSSSNPAVTLYGNNTTVAAYKDLVFRAPYGKTEFVVSSGRNLVVNGSGSTTAVTNSTTLLNSSSGVDVYGGSSVSIKSGDTTALNLAQDATLQSRRDVYIRSSGRSADWISIEAATNGTVRARGIGKWYSNGASKSYVSPFKLRTVTCTMPANTKNVNFKIDGNSLRDDTYLWTVAGVDSVSSSAPAVNVSAAEFDSNLEQRIVINCPEPNGSAWTYNIRLLGVIRELCTE